MLFNYFVALKAVYSVDCMILPTLYMYVYADILLHVYQDYSYSTVHPSGLANRKSVVKFTLFGVDKHLSLIHI